MARSGKNYQLPPGYSTLQSLFRSNDFLSNPIRFISQSMDRFAGTYTAKPGLKLRIILTQDAEFINYILKVNHKNYHKSPLATERAVQFFGNGLLFSNGEYWLRQRRLIQPAFHKEKLQGLYYIMNSSVQKDLANLPTGGSTDMYPLTHQVSFNILIRSLFDIRLSPDLINELSQLFTELQAFLMKDVNQPLRRIFYGINGTKRVHLRKAARLKQILAGIITERRNDPSSYNDLLDMLLNSRYEDTGEAMTDEQIIDEALIMIFAGHETTANALSWILYLLATHPEVMRKLKDSLGSSEASLMNPYLRAVIHESLRLYPPAWMTERVALEDDQFGNVSFPKGTIIIPFFYGLHRDKNFWVNGEQFRPERFVEDEKLMRAKNFFPFGAGPRMCIGNNFALAEMSFFLSAFLQQFKISSTDQVPQLKPLITLRPDQVLLRIERL